MFGYRFESLAWCYLGGRLCVQSPQNIFKILSFQLKPPSTMPTLLNNSDLKIAVSEDGFIKHGKYENIDGIKYDFSISPRILKAKFKQPIDIDQLPETRKGDAVIEPGEVVFVLTQETLQLPDNVSAILIPKRKLSHDGIMILGGLSVDPLYEGKLLIGLYNLSSSQYPIIPGRKVIGAQFYRLSDTEKLDVIKPDIRITDFPDELIRLMQSYKPVSAEALMNSVSSLEIKFDNLLQEFRTKDDWFNKLQDSMDKQEKTIDKILQGLEKEATDRRDSDGEIEKKVDGMRDEVKGFMKESYKTAAIIGVVGALVISALFKYFLEPSQPVFQYQAPPQQQSQPINMDSLKNAIMKELKDTSNSK